MGTELVGYLASALVLSTFLATDMRLLRLVAILSNVAFLTYGVLAGADPVICLHALLLPLNIFRLLQLTATTTGTDPAIRSPGHATSPAAHQVEAQAPSNMADPSDSLRMLSARKGRRRNQARLIVTKKQVVAV